MTYLEPTRITSWHAHVYFDAATRDAARVLRDAIAERLASKVGIGRFHERPVGPHPMWSYQLEFAPADFSEVIGWLALNHGPLDVFAHPNTGSQLADHRDRALWLGHSHQLKLEALPPD